MAKNQKSYTPEFKQQIVDLYHTGKYSYPQLEREYGVNRSTISGWVKQLSAYQERKLLHSRNSEPCREKMTALRLKTKY